MLGVRKIPDPETDPNARTSAGNELAWNVIRLSAIEEDYSP